MVGWVSQKPTHEEHLAAHVLGEGKMSGASHLLAQQVLGGGGKGGGGGGDAGGAGGAGGRGAARKRQTYASGVLQGMSSHCPVRRGPQKPAQSSGLPRWLFGSP